jgi:DNA invertase Pin-like site-specific DNA recombinase
MSARTRTAISLADAKPVGREIINWFYDAGVSGDLEVSERPGFTTMLDRIDGNGVRTVIVESAEQFARDREYARGRRSPQGTISSRWPIGSG